MRKSKGKKFKIGIRKKLLFFLPYLYTYPDLHKVQSLDLNPFGDYIRQYTSNHYRNVSQDSELNFHKNDIILVPKHRIRSVMPKRHYGILEENSKKDEVLKHFLRSSVTKSFSVSDKFPPILID